MAQSEPNDRLSQEVEEFDQLMNQMMRSLHQNNPTWLMETDLTEAQFFTGMFIQQHGTSTMSEIANALGVSLSAITGIIDRMVKHGYVERIRDESDRRLVRVQLTEKGNINLDQILDHKNDHLRAILSTLNAEDRTTLLGVIRKINEALTQQQTNNQLGVK